MITGIAQIALLVREYDEALEFYRDKLGFVVVEDTQLEAKRWVRLRPPGVPTTAGGGVNSCATENRSSTELLLSRAVSDEQRAVVGRQAGGRVLFFLHTNDFDGDYARFCARGVEFFEQPRRESYGKVAVMKDLYGNRIDLIETAR